MEIRYLGAIRFVRDIHVARAFYEELLEQEVEFDFGVNVSFVGGLAIHDRAHAEHELFAGANTACPPLDPSGSESYFEVRELDALVARLTEAETRFIHPVREQPWGQRVCRLYDPDGHIVELGEPMDAGVHRLMDGGMTLEQAAERVGMPIEAVRDLASNG